MIAIDSSTLIAYIQGDRGADVEALDAGLAAGDVVLPPVVLAEVLSDPALHARHRALLLAIRSREGRATDSSTTRSASTWGAEATLRHGAEKRAKATIAAAARPSAPNKIARCRGVVCAFVADIRFFALRRFRRFPLVLMEAPSRPIAGHDDHGARRRSRHAAPVVPGPLSAAGGRAAGQARSGNRTVNVAPRSTSLCTITEPPCACTMCRVIKSPRPRPP